MKSVSVDSVRYDVIERCSKISDPKTRDIGVKNKWNWNWLQERDFSENEDFLSDYIVKINKPGAAYCLYCNIDIAYGSSGKRNLRKHAQRNEKHAEQRKIRVTNMALPLLFFEPTDSTIQEKTCSLPYGAPINIHDKGLCTGAKIVQPQPIVSIVDRKSVIEVHLLSFLCEHNLPISLAPKLLQLCKDVNRDPKALNEISMSPGAATYKTVHGLGLFYNKAVICKLQKNSFSVNIDKCTASNGMKVFTILVSYFDDELERSTEEHYKSKECIDISAEILSEKILNAFTEDKIPLENLISEFSDSAKLYAW